MEMIIDFPSGAKVDAHFGPYTVPTDQPAMGDGSAPTPFGVFLASIGTCAGIFVLGFCRQRGIPTEGIRITQRNQPNRVTGLIEKIAPEIQVPSAFPQTVLQRAHPFGGGLQSEENFGAAAAV